MRCQLSAVSCRLFVLGGLALGARSIAAQTIPPLPDSSGWGVHVLALARGPDSSIWVGTYGQGIFVLRPQATSWEHIQSSSDTAKHAISWDFVHAFGFGRQGEVWYGTVGNGWGVSVDGGRTWKNWELRQLGPEWQYVAPNGIVTRGDTVYIATADGIKVTWDDGKTWRVITDLAGAATATDSVMGVIQNQYVLAIALGAADDPDNYMWISDLHGIAHSPDGGRTWHEGFAAVPCEGKGCVGRARTLLVDSKKRFWVGTENGVYRFGREFTGWGHLDACSGIRRSRSDCPSSDWWSTQQMIELRPGLVAFPGPIGIGGWRTSPFLLLAYSNSTLVRLVTSVIPPGAGKILVGGQNTLDVQDTTSQVVVGGDDFPPSLARAASLRHTWFRRPIDVTDQPHIDQTYRFGSTMGGNFQPHQGVEFNNPDGTQVHAIGDGVVVYSGLAEAGSNTVAIRHNKQLDGQYVFSVYYHNSKLLVTVGQKVKAGDVIALAGNTGRATNDHLHLEVHVAPTSDSSKIVAADVRYPPFNRNPELWIEPLPGTGVVAGQAWDAKGQPVQQARIYGLVKPEPQETPFSFMETYGPRNHSDPVYQEHFAIGDVPPGTYTLGVAIDGKKVFRRIEVKAGKLTWVEFRP
jgi:murein DD-endopeptidase MepM/ murein hydrolase activator NlpD